ncbi:S-layer family protein [Ruminiclostridium sufflavum DSM 19573]|uniref:S-layer family protein n=1 Tax=Ruminiclostridium sufflavum DSM 19573 TaxID=1121337 RepID=A0A318XFJ2_9FIRM|nr:S-layer homology domain-containing protein [Ruminiclostridium sufflavum]PYG84328.1 S-layer family protein [Ruminiclostridium sufflavum DSM 19573]
MKKYFKKITAYILAVFIITALAVPAFAEGTGISADNPADENATTASLRMKPLTDKYNSLTQTDLDRELARYTDTAAHWGRSYIARISALEIIAGYTDGRFGPNDKLLAGQYILMLVRTLGFKPEVPQGTPYYQPFADIALKEGLLKKGEIADYTKPMTRELAASLARRAIGTYEEVPADYFVKGSDPYPCKGDKGFFDNVYVGYQKLKMTDYTSITSSRLQDVIDCYRMGLLTGSDNKFSPKGTLTRAEASVIIVKLIDKTMRAESIPASDESFKWKNSVANNGSYDNEAEGFYENKEYTLYKGLFPMMEIWDTAKAMYDNRKLISGGKTDFLFSEGNKSFSIAYFNDNEHFSKYSNNNPYGLILPLNTVGMAVQRTQIPKGQEQSLYDNGNGWLYQISSYETDKYNKYLKSYCCELLKVWFGSEYEQAKKIHDQYLGYALNDQSWKSGVYLLNGRQIYVIGGRSESGNSFAFQVWAKGFITKETMLK